MHFRHENTSAEGIALAHTVYGQPVTATGRPDSTQPNVQLAVGNIMAPYKPPPRRDLDNPELALCAEEDCKAFPVKGLDYCAGHSRKRGLMSTCQMCGRIPLKGTRFCYQHSKKDDADGDAE